MHFSNEVYKEAFPDPVASPVQAQKVETAVETFTPSNDEQEPQEVETDLGTVIEPEEPAPAEIEVPAESEVSDGNE